MKQITAYIQPFMADKVTDALRDAGIHGMTLLPCSGFGRLAAEPRHYFEEKADLRGFASKAKLEIVCADADKDAILAVIREYAHTGRHGDGKIFVSTIDEALDIRTGSTSDVV